MYGCAMLPRTSNTIEQIDREIAEAERLIHERVQSIISSLRTRANMAEAEKRVREMRAALELLYTQRRKLVRAAYDDTFGQPLVRSADAA